jgi:flagellin-specific chaperone FliS
MIQIPDELNRLEESIYDCQNVTYDIKKSEKYADDLDAALDAISTLYDIKFKELIARYEEVERSYINLKEAWEDMHPDKVKEREKELDKDLFGNIVMGEDGC